MTQPVCHIEMQNVILSMPSQTHLTIHPLCHSLHNSPHHSPYHILLHVAISHSITRPSHSPIPFTHRFSRMDVAIDQSPMSYRLICRLIGHQPERFIPTYSSFCVCPVSHQSASHLCLSSVTRWLNQLPCPAICIV